MSREPAYGPGRLFHRASSRGRATYVLDFVDATGRRRRQPLSSDKSVAERRQREIIRQRDMELSGLAPVEGMNTPLAELIGTYVADLRTRATAKHLRNVEASLRHTLEALQAVRVRDLRAIDVIKYRAKLVDEGAANRTANLHTDRLHAALAWAVTLGLIAQNPVAVLPRLAEGVAHQRCRRRAMTDDEIDRFLMAADADDRACEENFVPHARSRGATRLRSLAIAVPRIPQAPLFTFLVHYGARYGEPRTLRWADVRLDECVVTLRAENTKSRKARCVPIRREFANVLAGLRKLHARAIQREPGDGDFVFLSPEARPLREDTVNVMRVFDRLLVAAKIDRVDALGRKLDLHALRGTCASALQRRRVGVTIAQKLLGHSSPVQTAKHYTYFEVDDIRAAIEIDAPTPPLRATPKREASA
jgi:integrase